MNIKSSLFLALILASSFVCLVGAEAEKDKAADKTSSLTRGLEWLAAKQKPDGSWSNESFPALTALPLRAFIKAGIPGHEDVIKRAEAFILEHVQSDGGIYKKSIIPGKGGLSTFNTALCMTALHELGKPEHIRIVQNARTFMAASQLTGDEDAGGFGYSGPGWFRSADMMNTSYAMEAMKVTESVEDLRPEGEARVDVDWESALKFVENLQNKEDTGPDAGGMFYKPGKSAAGKRTGRDGKVIFKSYGTMTYLGLLSMTYADLGRDDHRVRSALDWAANHWTLEENPGLGKQGMYFFYHVLTRALSAASIDEIKPGEGKSPIKWKSDVERSIINLQRDDGSWVNENGRYWESDPVLVTSYCLLALEAI